MTPSIINLITQKKRKKKKKTQQNLFSPLGTSAHLHSCCSTIIYQITIISPNDHC